MTETGIGLADTSVYIATENARRVDTERLPEELVISVVTLAELHAGVLAAPTIATRATRMATLESVRDVEVLPIDGDVALVWAQLRTELAQSGRRVNVNDLWIAASAAARGMPVVTQDDDFDAIEGMAGLTVVRV